MLPVALTTVVRAELTRLLFQAWHTARPEVAKFISDPSGTVVRYGDALVWSGPTGQKVIGGLEMLSDSQARIDAAVNGIQTATLSMQGVLGVVNSVSIATLGMTSLSGAFMAWRLQALNKRIDTLAKSVKDVEGKLDAQNKAHLKSSLQYLKAHDDDSSEDTTNLERALDEARRAANIYGTLAADEANDLVRLPVLNLRGRLFVVSLLTELRCMMSADNPKQALDRIEEETPNLKRVAEACFAKTLKEDPERYLRAAFQTQGVSLDLLASIYRQAKQLQIIDQPVVDDANSMFEHVRSKLDRKAYLSWFKRSKVSDEMQKLRYLLACLEESSRIEGLRLTITETHREKRSLSGLIAKLKEWRRNQVAQEVAGEAPAVYAYAF